MKILSKTLAAFTLLVCICFINVNSASAKVCFASDPGCSGGADFGNNYKDDSANLCLEVRDGSGAAIYKPGPCPQKTHVASVCPYNAKYVQCCGDAYAYSACVYPMENAGKCGSSYKCICSKEKFPITPGNCRNNSIPGGTNCVQVNDDDKNMSIHYEKCVCDSGLYPYKQNSDCEENQIVDTRRSCTDSDSVNHYYRCKCPDGWSTCATMDGKGAVGAKKCYSDGNIFHSQCCSCPAPFERSMNDVYATDYEYCPCNDNFRKASGCKFGYKVENGKCVEMTCGDALEALFASTTTYSSYGLYKGSALSASTIVVGDNTSGDWSHFYNKKVMSGAAFMSQLTGSSSYVQNAKAKCTNSIPKITMGYGSSNINGKLDFTSVLISYSSSLWNKSTFECTNCGLDIWMLYNNDGSASINFKYDSSKPNANNMYLETVGAEISRPFRTVGYNIKSGSLGFFINNNRGYGANVIMMEGKNNSQRMSFDADYFTVLGLAAIKYANVRSNYTCIGTKCSYGSSYGVYFDPGNVYNTSSTLSLYNTTFYLYEYGVVRNLDMSTSTMLGKEGDGTVSIVFSSGSYNTVTFSQLWSYCSKRPDGNYPFISTYGSVSNRWVDCGYYSQSVRDGEKHSKPDNARCRINGNNDQYGYSEASGSGCRWRDGDGSDRTPYFQFNGGRGWARN